MNGSSNIKGSAVYSFATDGWRASAGSISKVKAYFLRFKSRHVENNNEALA